MGSAAWNQQQQVDMTCIMHSIHEILQLLFRRMHSEIHQLLLRLLAATVRRRGGRAPCMIRDPTAVPLPAVRRAAVAHHA